MIVGLWRGYYIRLLPVILWQFLSVPQASFALEVSAGQLQRSEGHSAESLKELGVKAFEEGNFEEAVRYLSAAKAADTNNPVLAAALGQAFLRAGQTRNAIAPLQEALSANPSDVSVRLALAQCYQLLNLDERVLELLQVKTQAPPALWLFTLAFSEFRMEQYTRAEEIFHNLAQTEGMAAAANFFVANCKFGEDDLKGALPWYEAAIRHGNVEQSRALNAYYYNYGLALFRLGKYSEASAAFLASAKRNIRDPLPQYFLGRSQMEAGQTEDAISIFEQLLQDHPDFSSAYYQLGVLYRRSGNPERAKQMFAKVKQIKDAEIKEEQLLKGMKFGDR